MTYLADDGGAIDNGDLELTIVAGRASCRSGRRRLRKGEGNSGQGSKSECSLHVERVNDAGDVSIESE